MVAFAIGISIFVSDFAIRWLSYILSFIPMIFVVALIVGILAGSIENGTGTYIVTLIVGNIIGALIMAIAIALSETSLVSQGFGFDDFVMLFFAAPFYAVSGESSLLNGFAITSELGQVSFMFAPILYFVSFGFVIVGGKIGEYLQNEPEDDSELQSSMFPKEVAPRRRVELEEIVDSTDSTN